MSTIFDLGSTISLQAQSAALSASGSLVAGSGGTVLDLGSPIGLRAQSAGFQAFVGVSIIEDVGEEAELVAQDATLSAVVALNTRIIFVEGGASSVAAQLTATIELGENGTGSLQAGAFPATAVSVSGAGNVFSLSGGSGSLQSASATLSAEMAKRWERLPGGSKTWLKAAEESDTWTPIAKGNKNWN